MGSDNPTGADNQQERPSSSSWLCKIPGDLGNWVAGFVDGEGSFNIPFRQERVVETTFESFQTTRLTQLGAPASASEAESGPLDNGSVIPSRCLRHALRNWESSETMRRAPSLKQRDEDMVHAPWRHGETREL